MAVRQIILTIHHELAIGVDENRLNELYETELRPFIRLFYARQEWVFTHYLCGETLQWLQVYHSEALSAMHELVSRKQMEILGGSYYPAFIPLLSTQDRTAQMVEMALALRTHFGKKPHGAYLNGDIWEPSLAHSLKTGDLHYTFVDRSRFIASGIYNPGELFLTEEMGKVLSVFPFYRLKLDGDIDAEIEHILQLPCEGEGLLSLVSDASDVNALEKVLNGLQSRGVVFTLPSRIMMKSKNGLKALPRVYLPASSGAVFNSHTQFYRNEIFKHFSLQLFHAKNIYTALSVRQIKRDKSRKHAAIHSVLRAQNYQVYWQSRFGGFFNARARAIIMDHLLQADMIVREADAINYGLIRADFDMDGMDEALYQSRVSNAFVHARGAALFTFDYFPAGLSLLNVFVTDHMAGYSRAFHDFFFDYSFTYENWLHSFSEHEEGQFAQQIYDLVDWKLGSKAVRYSIERNFDETLLLLQKEYRFHPSSLEVRYLFANQALGYIHRQFGVEFNLSIAEDTHLVVDKEILLSNVSLQTQSFSLHLLSHQIYIHFEVSELVTIWKKDIFGECAEIGKHHQGVALLLLFPMDLNPSSETSLSIKMRISKTTEEYK
ncbi:DUF1926 domain-containing protein [Entomospira entomophila]|uniref:DUF1926 domain-containing protein n=1 Tax=Entomospira entomophila TaxID=2719988 RepID=A0A968KWU5_9SPIO|nr:alpha-amylase/4-alpha-glucanotransferase domain-containing protein [Entomospira entomophilus]NIZ41175.1 DUF1926 domain-containing protein [Entomospira entomophilus]WDI35382.1 DUF1926 domain-containing protein [Entomospira entomophilus]